MIRLREIKNEWFRELARRKYLLALLPLVFLLFFFIFFDYSHQGSMQTQDFSYVGGIQNNKPQGQGRMTFSNGDIYLGGFKRGKYQGQGTYTSKAGNWVYRGNFSDGLANGMTTIQTPDGKSHQINMKAGVIHP